MLTSSNINTRGFYWCFDAMVRTRGAIADFRDGPLMAADSSGRPQSRS
jgi:hypothetical protein